VNNSTGEPRPLERSSQFTGVSRFGRIGQADNPAILGPGIALDHHFATLLTELRVEVVGRGVGTRVLPTAAIDVPAIMAGDHQAGLA
jgi:hypothetical protein